MPIPPKKRVLTDIEALAIIAEKSFFTPEKIIVFVQKERSETQENVEITLSPRMTEMLGHMRDCLASADNTGWQVDYLQTRIGEILSAETSAKGWFSLFKDSPQEKKVEKLSEDLQFSASQSVQRVKELREAAFSLALLSNLSVKDPRNAAEVTYKIGEIGGWHVQSTGVNILNVEELAAALEARGVEVTGYGKEVATPTGTVAMDVLTSEINKTRRLTPGL